MNRNGIGWGLAALSIGLGLAELIAPRRIARTLGTEGHERLIQGFGVRELASGAALLGRPRSPAAVWTRVAGDALDLAALGSALRSRRSNSGAVAGAIAFVAGAALIDILAARALAR